MRWAFGESLVLGSPQETHLYVKELISWESLHTPYYITRFIHSGVRCSSAEEKFDSLWVVRLVLFRLKEGLVPKE